MSNSARFSRPALALVPSGPGGTPLYDLRPPPVVVSPRVAGILPASAPTARPTTAAVGAPLTDAFFQPQVAGAEPSVEVPMEFSPDDGFEPVPSRSSQFWAWARASILTAWDALTSSFNPAYAGNPARAAAVALRQAALAFPDGPPTDHVLRISIPADLCLELTGRAIRQGFARSLDWRGIRTVVVHNGDASLWVRTELIKVEPRQFTAHIVFPGAGEVRAERIHGGRRSLRLGRGRQRQDRSLNHVAFDDDLTWMPRTLADIEWSPTECSIVLDLPPGTARTIVVTLRRGDERSVVEAGEHVRLEGGDILLFTSTQGEHELAVRIEEINP